VTLGKPLQNIEENIGVVGREIFPM
jgi:hypothetical protein